MNGIEANESIAAIVLPMLWVFVLMAAVVINVVSKHRNERMNKRIGVEIELIKAAKLRDSPHEKMSDWLTKQIAKNDLLKSAKQRGMLNRIRIKYSGYTHEVTEVTKLVTDGSLNHGGFEVVSPPLSGDLEQRSWVQRICQSLRGVAGVDSSCSVHVHVGLRDYDTSRFDAREMGVESVDDDANYNAETAAKAVVGRVGWAYGYFQSVLNKMVSPSRRNGRWSRDITYMCSQFDNITELKIDSRVWCDEDEEYQYISRTVTSPVEIGLALFEHLLNGGGHQDSRYQCVNPQAFRKYGTIEFRSHQGSTNPTKIQNWIDIVHLLTTRCASESWTDITDYNGKSYHDFMTWLGIATSDNLYEAGIRRIKSVNGNDSAVFAHDPSIQHSQLFQAVQTCTKCGKVTCDHDSECGVNYADKLADEINEHFGGNDRLNYPDRICDDCCNTSAREASYVSREFSEHTVAYCDDCDEETTFQMWGGLALSLALGTIPLALVVVGCGIGAIHAVNKRFKHKRVASKLFKVLSERGKQASGFAFDNGDGVYYVKAPHSSHAMAHHTGKQLSADTIWTMMHTRYATHGINNKANAHPHFGSEAWVTMVHNGVVHNSDKVWAGLGTKRTGPVDSQAVAQCLEVGGIEKVVDLCEGSMSLIWSDSREPKGTLKCWTNGASPLVMGRLDDATVGPVVIASTLALLKQGVGKRLKTDWAAEVGREYTILPDGSITKRDIVGSADTAGVYRDWRDYTIGTGTKKSDSKIYGTLDYQGGYEDDYMNTEGQTRSVWKPKPNHRIIALANKHMAKAEGSYPPLEGKWHGYDAATHEGISNSWDHKGEPISYSLPQWVTPQRYKDDLISLLRGDYEPVNGEKSYDYLDTEI